MTPEEPPQRAELVVRAEQEPPGGWDRPLVRAGDEVAVKRGLGRTWAFVLVNAGLNAYYWFFVTRRQLDAELADDRDDAILHTAGLSVPGLNLVIVHWLWRDLNHLRTRVGLASFSEIPYLVGSVFLAPLFYSLVLLSLNEYWDVRTEGRAVNAPVTTGEMIVLAVGAVFLALWLLLLLVVILVTAGVLLAD